MEVTGIIACFSQEILPFFTSLKSYEHQKTTEWFFNLQAIIKSSLNKQLQSNLKKLEKYGNFANFLKIKKQKLGPKTR